MLQVDSIQSDGSYHIVLSGKNQRVTERLGAMPKETRDEYAREAFEFGVVSFELLDRNGAAAAIAQGLKDTASATRDELTKATNAVKKTLVETSVNQQKFLSTELAGVAKKIGAVVDPATGADVQKMLHAIAQTNQASTNKSNQELEKKFNLADPTSALGSIDRKIVALNENVVKLTANMEAQTRAVQARTKTPAKGLDLEEFAARVIGPIASSQGDAFEHCADTAGLIERCMNGDHIVELDTARTQGQILRTVIESKNRPKFGVNKLLEEMRKAERNRGALTSLGLLTNGNVGAGTRPIAVYDNQRVIVALPNFGAPDADYEHHATLIATAYDLARLLILTKLRAPVVEAVNLDGISAEIDELASMSSLCTTVKDNLTRCGTAIENTKTTVDKVQGGVNGVVSRLRSLIAEEVRKIDSAAQPKALLSVAPATTVALSTVHTANGKSANGRASHT